MRLDTLSSDHYDGLTCALLGAKAYGRGDLLFQRATRRELMMSTFRVR